MTWWDRHPGLLRDELSSLESAFPEMQVSAPAQKVGLLALHGTLPVRTRLGTENVPVVLSYPPHFPLWYPVVRPRLREVASQHDVAELLDPSAIRFFSARHQMADGSICLFEAPHAAGRPLRVTGVDALRRAELWLSAAVVGKTPSGLDSIEAALAEHYEGRGDILCGAGLYHPDLPDTGRFVAVVAREGEQARPLYIITHVEDDGAEFAEDWRSFAPLFPEVTEVLDRVLGGGGKRRKTSFDQLRGKPQLLLGRWFTLRTEPLPVRSLEELAVTIFGGETTAAVEQLDKSFLLERRTNESIVVALRYPARKVGEWDWLFLHIRLREAAQPTVAVDGIGKGVVLDFGRPADERWRRADFGALRAHDMRRRKLEIRNGNVFSPDISSLSLGLLGTGGLGSLCADLLVKAGIEKLSVWDSGVLEAANAIRHTASIRGTGLLKALLVTAESQQHNPHVVLEPHFTSVLVEALLSTSALWRPRALVSTIAEDATELALNEDALRNGQTVYYLRGLRKGEVGRLIRVKPGVDACLECVARYHDDQAPDAVVVLGTEGEVVARECGQAILAASASDLAVIAGYGVRRILEDTAKPGNANQWVWTTTGVPGLQGLDAPFSMRVTSLPPHPECSLCGRRPIGAIRIPQALLQTMIEHARRAAPSETGGILVGRLGDDGRIIEVTAVSDAGPNATCRPDRFERDGQYCQLFLERVVREQGSVDYVGEWHSHPGTDATPSLRDHLSLAALAYDPDYLTSAPVMVIIGLPGAGEPDVRATIHPLGSQSYRLELHAVTE